MPRYFINGKTYNIPDDKAQDFLAKNQGATEIEPIADFKTETEQYAKLFEDEDWVTYIEEKIPLGRIGNPNDLDGTCLFLASDASAYVTGQTILVDGGISVGAVRAMPANNI